MGRRAGAHRSLSQTKWPAGSGPAGRGCVHSFSGPGRNSKCVLPLPPLLLSLVGAGLWASGEDASAGPGLQAGTAAEAMGHAPLSPLDTPTP